MTLRTIVHGLRRLVRGAAVERDLQDQVAHYLEEAAREHERAGLSPAEAARRARVEFGGVEAAKEAVRSAGWDGWLDGLCRDLGYGIRSLRRNPGFTIVAVLTLALGIGANTAMFSVVNAVVLQPLPYREPDRLTMIWTDDRQRGLDHEATASRTIRDWQASARSFSEIGFFSAERTTLNDNGDRERTRRTFVSGNLFDTVGVRPTFGRTIGVRDEQDAAPVAVISHALWLRRYGGSPAALGRTLVLEGAGRQNDVLQIVGVMPAGFYFPDRLTEIWTPSTTYWRFARESVERFPGWARRWTAIGRLAPGRSVDEASGELASIGERLTALYPPTVPDFPGFTTHVVALRDQVTGRTLQTTLWMLLGAVGLVLLVACANIANLLLARGTARRQEFAIRRALGAGRSQLVRQLMAESLVVAMLGGAAGVALAAAGTTALTALAAGAVPRVEDTAIDGMVLLFAFGASLLSAFVFGALPAVRVSIGDPSRSLNDATRATEGPRHRRARSLLVLSECLLAVILLTGAGLLLRSLDRLRHVDPGFDPSGVLMVRIEFAPDQRGDEAERSAPAQTGRARARASEQVMSSLVGRVRGLPAVEHAGFVDDLFLVSPGNESITIPGRSADAIPAGELVEGSASPGSFEALKAPLLRGRYLTRDDAVMKMTALWTPSSNRGSLVERSRTAVAEPVVVNQAFAKRFFAAEDPIGKRFCIDPNGKTYWYEIVGVIGDMRRHGLERQAIPQYFGPLLPAPNARADLLVRTQGSPLALAAVLRQIVREGLPGSIVASVTTADEQLAAFSSGRDLQTWLLSIFAALALGLAAVGIYGVVHFTVAERTREIGVRMALGATPAEVVRLVAGSGLRMPIAGLALGLVCAAGATRLLSHLVFGIGTTDPATFASVAVLLAIVAVAACYIPARRATRIDPVQALRGDT